MKLSQRRGNNARMHPRNRYAYMRPDYTALARDNPSLQPYLIPTHMPAGDHRKAMHGSGRGWKRAREGDDVVGKDSVDSRSGCTFDFTNAQAARELTKVHC